MNMANQYGDAMLGLAVGDTLGHDRSNSAHLYPSHRSTTSSGACHFGPAWSRGLLLPGRRACFRAPRLATSLVAVSVADRNWCQRISEPVQSSARIPRKRRQFARRQFDEGAERPMSDSALATRSETAAAGPRVAPRRLPPIQDRSNDIGASNVSGSTRPT
jgi:hypothetical protein